MLEPARDYETMYYWLSRHTRHPWELIVVDNGSTDGTSGYLAGVQDASAVPVTVIANATNRGFPAAINQALQEARGEFIVLLNNDVVVTDAWLDQLIALAHASTDGVDTKQTRSQPRRQCYRPCWDGSQSHGTC